MEGTLHRINHFPKNTFLCSSIVLQFHDSLRSIAMWFKVYSLINFLDHVFPILCNRTQHIILYATCYSNTYVIAILRETSAISNEFPSLIYEI